jgi:hypothetical protein
MDEERVARLRTHQKNLDRYQDLLKTALNKSETDFLEGRLLEERLEMARLELFQERPPEFFT